MNSTADPRCGLREWPVLPLRGGTKFLARAAFPALRAQAARQSNSQCGLSAAIGTVFGQWPLWISSSSVTEAPLMEKFEDGEVIYSAYADGQLIKCYSPHRAGNARVAKQL